MPRCKRILCWLMLAVLSGNCSHEEKHTPNPYQDDIPAERKIHLVEIKQMKFVPAEVYVHRGDKITWVNHDLVTHDITEETHQAWTSAPLPAGSSWSMVAAQNADYYCSIHVVMKGKVIVQ